MKTQIEIAAQIRAIAEVGKSWGEMVSEAQSLAASKIKLVNLARRVGIGIQEICGRDQLQLNFFQTFAAKLPPGLTFAAAKNCVKLANAMPEPAKTVEDANRAEQLVFEATGVMEAPKRLEQHTSRDVAPATFFFTTFAEIREKVNKKIAGWSEWDEETQEGVRREVERAEKWIAEVKTAIS